MKILVVDDSAFTRQRLCRLFSDAGYETVEADSGNQALAVFPGTAPDVVTVDLLMPGMGGIELTREIRKISADVPIVVISADTQDVTRQEVISAGGTAFISKTAPAEEFFRVLHRQSVQSVQRDSSQLTHAQHDAFKEMINIAMGEAARSLSQLLFQKIQLRVPEVEIMTPNRLKAFFESDVHELGAIIQQKFSGRINGNMALILPKYHAAMLVRTLISEASELGSLSSAEQAVLSEIGNIVLNAAISKIANMLRSRLQVALPAVKMNQTGQSGYEFFCGVSSGSSDSAVICISRLSVGDIRITAYLGFLMPQDDIHRLIHVMEMF